MYHPTDQSDQMPNLLPWRKKKKKKHLGCYTEKVNAYNILIISSSSPILSGAHNAQVGGKILFPACTAQKVVWASWSAFASKPAVHVGPVAAVTTATGTLTATRVVTLHVVVELQGESVTQLTLHHLMGFWVLFSSLRQNRCMFTQLWDTEKYIHIWTNNIHTTEQKIDKIQQE